MTVASRPPEPTLQSRLAARITPTVPGARVRVVSMEDGRGIASVEARDVRLRMHFEVRLSGHISLAGHALEGLALLSQLADAGVSLSRSGPRLVTQGGLGFDCRFDFEKDDGAFVCADASARSGVERAALASPAWLMPPSRRRRAGGRPPRPTAMIPSATPEAQRVLAVLRRNATLRLQGLRLSASQQVFLVLAHAFGPPTGVMLCVADAAADRVDCETTQLDAIEGVVASHPHGWLLIAQSAYGNPRSNSRFLVATRRDADGLALSDVHLGSLDGLGEGCTRYRGYCVDVSVEAYSARMLTPTCLERRPEAGWSARHVRVGDRWVNQRIKAPPRCADRFALRAGAFVQTACGPPARRPPCPEASPPHRDGF